MLILLIGSVRIGRDDPDELFSWTRCSARPRAREHKQRAPVEIREPWGGVGTCVMGRGVGMLCGADGGSRTVFALNVFDLFGVKFLRADR